MRASDGVETAMDERNVVDRHQGRPGRAEIGRDDHAARRGWRYAREDAPHVFDPSNEESPEKRSDAGARCRNGACCALLVIKLPQAR
jgi:hypothetical protein